MLIAAISAPAIVAGCTGPPAPPAPDPLQPLLAAAFADAALADAVAAAHPPLAPVASALAADRRAHAASIEAEVRRATPSPSATSTATAGAVAVSSDRAGAVNALAGAARSAQVQAADLVVFLPRHRAGLVASVAACCASHLIATDPAAPAAPASGSTGGAATGPTAGPTAGPVTSTGGTAASPAPETADAVQRALAAEHAALWALGLVTAFLPAAESAPLAEADATHRARRDAAERLLRARGATPLPAEPAYATPAPVTDRASALALLITAESDVAAAWRSVVERTDEAAVRTLAAGSLADAAIRLTRWRRAAGVIPLTVPFPGAP